MSGKVTNEQKYETAEERIKAFHKWVGLGVDRSVEKFARWLALEAEDDKQEPCPFCGRETSPRHLAGGFCVECDCGYTSPFAETEDDAVAKHNRVARAVRAAESKKGE